MLFLKLKYQVILQNAEFHMENSKVATLINFVFLLLVFNDNLFRSNSESNAHYQLQSVTRSKISITLF